MHSRLFSAYRARRVARCSDDGKQRAIYFNTHTFSIFIFTTFTELISYPTRSFSITFYAARMRGMHLVWKIFMPFDFLMLFIAGNY